MAAPRSRSATTICRPAVGSRPQRSRASATSASSISAFPCRPSYVVVWSRDVGLDRGRRDVAGELRLCLLLVVPGRERGVLQLLELLSLRRPVLLVVDLEEV